MKGDLTTGSITGRLLRFALPLMVGNLLQQLYNVADTLIVGRFLGADALAAVGSSYSLMTFLTSILLGLCMGSSAYFSIQFGRRDDDQLKNGFFLSFVLIGAAALVLTAASFALLDRSSAHCRRRRMSLRSCAPICLSFSSVSQPHFFITTLPTCCAQLAIRLRRSYSGHFGCAQHCARLGICARVPLGCGGRGSGDRAGAVCFGRGPAGLLPAAVSGVARCAAATCGGTAARCAKSRDWSVLTCVQQSVMNLGILMVQGLVNSFGTAVMAAFAAAVKIDSFAYMPVQDFGNAFSTFVAQNYGAGKPDRIRRGIRSAVICAVVFCIAVGAAVCVFAAPLMGLFVQRERTRLLRSA